MGEFAVKFKRIFIPYIIIAIATIGSYTLLNWILFIKTTAFNVDEDIINIIGTMVFPWIPILIWIRPRIKLLRLQERRNRNPLMGYYMVIWAAIGFPLAISQQYLITASGTLTKLDHISQINSLPITKYYTISHFCIDKKLARIKPHFTVTEKGRSLDMYIYAPCPIFDDSLHTDTTKNHSYTAKDLKPFAWLVVRYSKTISNRLSSEEKENEYKQFARDCEINFEGKNLDEFAYLDKIGNNREFNGCKDAIMAKDTSGLNPIIILSPINEAYELKNGNKLPWIFGSFGIGALFFLITLSFSPLKEDLENKKESKDDFALKDLQIFIPHKGFYITPIIMDINIIVFIIMVCSGLGFITFGAPDL